MTGLFIKYYLGFVIISAMGMLALIANIMLDRFIAMQKPLSMEDVFAEEEEADESEQPQTSGPQQGEPVYETELDPNNITQTVRKSDPSVSGNIQEGVKEADASNVPPAFNNSISPNPTPKPNTPNPNIPPQPTEQEARILEEIKKLLNAEKQNNINQQNQKFRPPPTPPTGGPPPSSDKNSRIIDDIDDSF